MKKLLLLIAIKVALCTLIFAETPDVAHANNPKDTAALRQNKCALIRVWGSREARRAITNRYDATWPGRLGMGKVARWRRNISMTSCSITMRTYSKTRVAVSRSHYTQVDATTRERRP